jgi:hypothetical protein
MAANPADPDMATLNKGENLAGNYLFHLFWEWRTAEAVRHFHFTPVSGSRVTRTRLPMV